jgi:hypothetical protein
VITIVIDQHRYDLSSGSVRYVLFCPSTSENRDKEFKQCIENFRSFLDISFKIFRVFCFYAWVFVSSGHPRILIRGNEKQNPPALAIVTAAGGRLPLFFLARVKTERGERFQIGNVSPNRVSHSN